MARKAPRSRQREPHRETATNAILESISDGVFTVDHDWRISSFNRAAEQITGTPRDAAIGKRCAEVLRSSMCEAECALEQTLKTGKAIVNRSCFIIDARGRRVPISISTAVLRDGAGDVVGGAETFRDLSEVEELRKELKGRFQVGDLVSRSPAMRSVCAAVPVVAASRSTVLIQGETGTGKELLARAIHALGPRKAKPFVAVNCGALPDALLESELFGYKAGAFTGANKDKPGRFALAEGGSLFLDEVGEVSPALQVRLLRVLQEKSYEPLGGTGPEAADVRIIAAANRDLASLVDQGTFRADLYYRIHVVQLDLPPLRDRKEDVPLLVEHFVGRFNRIQGKVVAGASPEVLALLMAHRWPGNVRELENLVERAFLLCAEGLIKIEHLPEDFVRHAPAFEPSRGIDATRKAVEAQAICEALQRNQYNRLATARDLGIHKSTLFRKMKALGLSLPDKDGRSHSDKK